MDTLIDAAIPLVGAFVGAAGGAFFAFMAFRRERLWADRYEALSSVVLSLETIQSHFEAAFMESLGETVISAAEQERLEKEWPAARHELRRTFARLRLLFKDEQIQKLSEHHVALSSAFTDLYNRIGPEDSDDFEAIGKRAEEAISEAIRVAQRHSL